VQLGLADYLHKSGDILFHWFILSHEIEEMLFSLNLYRAYLCYHMHSFTKRKTLHLYKLSFAVYNVFMIIAIFIVR
jgi:hypothetical protein